LFLVLGQLLKDVLIATGAEELKVVELREMATAAVLVE